MPNDYTHLQPVRHKKRTLPDARFYGWSKSGKKVGVRYNILYPHGVHYYVAYFDPEMIEPERSQSDAQ